MWFSFVFWEFSLRFAHLLIGKFPQFFTYFRCETQSVIQLTVFSFILQTVSLLWWSFLLMQQFYNFMSSYLSVLSMALGTNRFHPRQFLHMPLFWLFSLCPFSSSRGFQLYDSFCGSSCWKDILLFLMFIGSI